MKGTTQWSGVSFYYASFHAAKVVSLTSGAWFIKKKLWIDIDRTSTNKIGFQIHRTAHPGILVGRGPHKDFWSFYQVLSNKIASEVTSQYEWAVVLDTNEIDLVHDLRKELNYDPQIGLETALAHSETYTNGEFSNWLHGRPATLYQYARAYVGYAVHRAKSIGLNAPVFDGIFTDCQSFAESQFNWTRNQAVNDDIIEQLRH
ncbi:hypothetical protein [Salinisphaera hydrothermalis]|uniref:hypothetical protein n=1 Tax=Salinisphaera hydrothermalis TaxID=563188 RepID=UPI0012EB6828|nr:hypothetical protein [Salinisphaera hydrothermalis]